MVQEPASRLALYDDLLRRFASGVRAAQLYSADHPLLGRNIDGLLAALRALHQQHASVTIGILGDELVVADTPMPKASAGMAELVKRLRENDIERIAFERGVAADELRAFVQTVAALSGKAAAPAARSPHIHLGRITAEETRQGGIASDMAAIRQLYATSVAAAQAVWESAETEGAPDVPAALQAVEDLAETVTQNRTAVIALTAMRNYDNYTFTHMVNVAILTMGQARGLGIEGRLLREFGMSALMHDIGKVRTPKEILNKTEALTDEEFAIMRRHTVDGSEILRRTPEMPLLSPVVAFEHHLRLDGTGYPFGVKRAALNLATMLCSISDVYDAMRSQRAYQRAFPTDRILAVLKRNDGKQFDQHLVRRFVQLLGVYPPGNLVRLGTGETAVVVSIHAPDPYRPRVRVLFDSAGRRLDVPVERNLWEPGPDPETASSIVGPINPSELGIDPLNFLPT